MEIRGKIASIPITDKVTLHNNKHHSIYLIIKQKTHNMKQIYVKGKVCQ